MPGLIRTHGPGQVLEQTVQRQLECVLQADLSSVRVHESPGVAAAGAVALTAGNDIYFAPGFYDPCSRDGLTLLGHELAHVVQQREGRVANPFGTGTALIHDPLLEREAARLGRTVARQLTTKHPGPAKPRRRPERPGTRVVSPMMAGVHYNVAKVEQARSFDCVYASLKMLLDYHKIVIPPKSSLEAFHGGEDIRFGLEHMIPVSLEFGLIIIGLHDGCGDYRPSDLERLLRNWGPVAAGLVFGRTDRTDTTKRRNHMVVINGIRDVYISVVDPVPDRESPLVSIGFGTLMTEVEYFVMPIPRDRKDLLAKWSGQYGRLKCEHARDHKHRLGW